VIYQPIALGIKSIIKVVCEECSCNNNTDHRACPQSVTCEFDIVKDDKYRQEYSESVPFITDFHSFVRDFVKQVEVIFRQSSLVFLRNLTLICNIVEIHHSNQKHCGNHTTCGTRHYIKGGDNNYVEKYLKTSIQIMVILSSYNINFLIFYLFSLFFSKFLNLFFCIFFLWLLIFFPLEII